MPQFYKDLWLERIQSIKVHPCSIFFMQFFGPWLTWGSMISWQMDLACSFSTVPMGHFRQHALPIPQKAQRPDLMSRMNRARICWKKLPNSLMWFENKVDHLQILQPIMQATLVPDFHCLKWWNNALVAFYVENAITDSFIFQLLSRWFWPLANVFCCQKKNKSEKWKHKLVTMKAHDLNIRYFMEDISDDFCHLPLAWPPHKPHLKIPSCWPQAIQQSSPRVGLPSPLCALEMASPPKKIGTFCKSQGWWVHFKFQLVPVTGCRNNFNSNVPVKIETPSLAQVPHLQKAPAKKTTVVNVVNLSQQSTVKISNWPNVNLHQLDSIKTGKSTNNWVSWADPLHRRRLHFLSTRLVDGLGDLGRNT